MLRTKLISNLSVHGIFLWRQFSVEEWVSSPPLPAFAAVSRSQCLANLVPSSCCSDDAASGQDGGQGGALRPRVRRGVRALWLWRWVTPTSSHSSRPGWVRLHPGEEIQRKKYQPWKLATTLTLFAVLLSALWPWVCTDPPALLGRVSDGTQLPRCWSYSTRCKCLHPQPATQLSPPPPQLFCLTKWAIVLQCWKRAYLVLCYLQSPGQISA